MMARLVALLRKSGDWIAPIAAVAMVFVMLVPLPSFVLDLLLTVSITRFDISAADRDPGAASSAILSISQSDPVAHLAALVARLGQHATHPAARE